VSAYKKVLIIAPSWVGDMVMAQSLFMTLKQAEPMRRIEVMAPEWSKPLLKRMPEVSRSITLPFEHGQLALSERIELSKSLRSRRYAQAIVLPNSWKSALIPFYANILLRTGYRGEMRWGLLNEVRKLDKQKLPTTVQRFVALGLPADSLVLPNQPIPQLNVTSVQQRVIAEKFRLNLISKVLAICPGAEYGEAKRWPVEHYAALANLILRQGWSVWILGSSKDKAIAAQINQLTEYQCQNFTAKTHLGEAVDLISLADVVVSNDSGLMHIAAALDKKLIALYGSSDPKFTPPLNPSAKILSLKLDCSPCFRRTCPLKHTRCLTDILPPQVLAEIELML